MVPETQMCLISVNSRCNSQRSRAGVLGGLPAEYHCQYSCSFGAGSVLPHFIAIAYCYGFLYLNPLSPCWLA